MVIQKTAVYKVLAIILVFVLLVGSSKRVEAAEDYGSLLTAEFVYNDEVYVYSYTDFLSIGDHTVTFSNPVYIFIGRQGVNGAFLAVSKEPFDYELVNIGQNYAYAYAESYGIYLFESYGDYYDQLINIPVNEHPNVDNSVFRSFIFNNDFEIDPFTPDWYNCEGVDPLFSITDLQADIIDNKLIITWKKPLFLPYRLMNHMYIQFQYAHRDPENYQSGRNRYIMADQYAKVSDETITIPLSALRNLPDDHYLSSILATPYYYKADNLENATVRGQSSQVYFDVQGVSSSPIVVSPEIKEEVPEENVEKNIFISVSNFFSGFFRNLTNTIKTAVVPSGDDVLALLQEMNDWFSVRFGFIWYPFDLAIDIMAAFALGEPDSKITVPALTLNMFGGVKLWDEFQADLDPIDFLKYVRFFTSTIMCGGTVSLAIRKWDEWIGGRSS